ncbi:MAG: TetR/AcrR family transcriptional regulator [Candidatus Phaeomarinobacter sp.]
MKNKTHKWRNPNGKRDLILVATLEAIGTGGIDCVTHRHVAEIAGVAVGSVGYHFDTREGLIREAFRYYVKGVTETVLSVAGDFERPTRKTVTEALLTISERDVDRPEFLRAEYEMLVYAGRDPELARDISEWHETLEGRLAGAREVLGVDRPMQAARMIRDLLRGIEIERLVRPQGAKTRLRGQIDMALNGLQLREPA